MEQQPRYIENRQFVGYEEEDIQKVNQGERCKFDQNPEITEIMKTIEQEAMNSGHWEEHWLTIDPSGKRVYARIYYTPERAWALTADGEIIREIDYPQDNQLSQEKNKNEHDSPDRNVTL
jgi:hypothetical protein